MGGPVVIVSDGSVCGERLGWGASADRVLATTRGELLADCPSSLAVEWVGKMEGALLAGRLGVPESALAFAVADNVSASLGPDGGRPSRCAWVDALRLCYARGVRQVWAPRGLHPGPARHSVDGATG